MADDNDATNPFDISIDDIEDEEEAEKMFSALVKKEPIIGEILDEFSRRRWIETEIDDETKVQAGETLVLTSHVSKDEVDFYMNIDECYNTFLKVKSDFEDEKVSQNLINLYHENAAPYIQEAEEYLEEIEQELFGSAYSDLVTIRQSDRENKEEILEIIKDSVLNDPDNEDIVNKRNRLLYVKNSLEKFPYDEDDLQEDLPKIDSDENRTLKHFAIQIYNPKLYTSLFQFEDDFEDFPLRWLTHLTIPEIRTLYRKYQSGEEVEKAVITEVEKDGYFDELISDCIKLPSLRRRKQIIEEVVANYRDERYASVINLLYPQIEYLIWIYAAFLDENEENLFIDVEYDNIWGFNYRNHDDLKIVSKNGNPNEDPHIRDVMQDTPVSDYFNNDIVEYFVNELFEERNPILHGNTSDYHSEVEAAKKIVFFNMIVEKVGESFVESTADHLEEFVEEEYGGWSAYSSYITPEE